MGGFWNKNQHRNGYQKRKKKSKRPQQDRVFNREAKTIRFKHNFISTLERLDLVDERNPYHARWTFSITK